MNEREEREWQAQEQARQRARTVAKAANLDGRGAARDQSVQGYEVIARALHAPLHDEPPSSFAAVSTQAIVAQAAHDLRLRRRFERRIIAAIVLAYGVVLTTAAIVFARDWLPALRDWHGQGEAWLLVPAMLILTGLSWRRR